MSNTKLSNNIQAIVDTAIELDKVYYGSDDSALREKLAKLIGEVVAQFANLDYKTGKYPEQDKLLDMAILASVKNVCFARDPS